MNRNPSTAQTLPLPVTGASYIVVIAAALFLWMISTLTAADVSVRAVLDPGQISLGRAAQMTLEISGAGSGKVALPTVENLEIGYIGQNTSFQFVNGLTSQKVFYFFQVVPHAEGTYVIPSFEVTAGGQKLVTAPLSLRVGAGQPPPSLPAPPSSSLGSSPVTAPPTSNAPSVAAAPAARTATPKPENAGNAVIVQMYSPTTDMYVGQMVPVTIKLYVRGDRQVELHSLPRLLGDAFTLNPPSKNFDQVQETIDGVPYKVAIWSTSITPVKTGDFTISTEINLRVAEQARRQRPPGFDDPLFDSIFTQYRMVDKTVHSNAQSWKVSALPSEGKPDNFAGAIGDFNLVVKATPDRVKVGEPINLEMIIEGKGNLDRVNAPTLTSTDGLKTYPPSSKIDPSDDSGVSGKKTFTEAVIPLKTGTLPSVTFSFFNPELKQYVTRTVDAPRVAITDAPAPAIAASSTPAAVASSTTTTTAAKTATDTKANEPALVPIKVEITPFVANFNPVFFNPLFAAVQTIPLVALLAGVFVARRRRRLESDPDYARAHETCRAVRQQLEAMGIAVSRNDAAAFFTAARRAVQYRLAERWKLKAEDISFDAIRMRNPELADSVQSLFNVADEIAYSGEARTDVSLAEWQKAIVALLSRLEKNV